MNKSNLFIQVSICYWSNLLFEILSTDKRPRVINGPYIRILAMVVNRYLHYHPQLSSQFVPAGRARLPGSGPPASSGSPGPALPSPARWSRTSPGLSMIQTSPRSTTSPSGTRKWIVMSSLPLLVLRIHSDKTYKDGQQLPPHYHQSWLMSCKIPESHKDKVQLKQKIFLKSQVCD